MAENGEVLIPVNLDIDEAERQINTFARNIAKAKIDLKVNDAKLEEARQKAEDLRQIAQDLQKSVKVNVDSNGVTTVTGAKEYDEAVRALEAQEAVVANLEKKQQDLNDSIEEYGRLINVLRNDADKGSGYRLGENTGDGTGIGKMLKSMLRRVFVFSVITSGLRAVRTAMSSLLKSNTELQKSLGQLKGNFLTLAYPILNLLIPALNTTVKVLSILIQQIGSLVFGIFGVNWGDVQKDAQKMAKNMKSGAGSAKEMKKSLMGIDEINQLQDNSSGGGGGGVGSASFSTQEVTDKLLEIEAVALGAVLALGVILFMAGNIPLGLGLIAVGALGLASAMKANWNSASQQVKNTLSKIVAIASGALLALGVLLVLSGAKVGLGIGMIVAGVAGMVSSVAINWDSTTSKIGEVIRTLTLLASGAMLVLGMLLLFSGANPAKGIALIGSAIAIGGTAFNFDYILKQLKPTIEQLKQIWNNFVAFWKDIWRQVKEGFAQFVESFKTMFNAVGTFIKELWNGIKEFFAGVVAWLVKAWNGFVNAVKTGVTAVANFFVSVWNSIKTAYNAVVEGFKTVLNGFVTFWTNVWAGIKNAYNNVVAGLKTGFTAFITYWTDSWNNVKTKFSQIVDILKNAWSNFTGGLGTSLRSAWEKVKNIFAKGGEIFEGIKDGISVTFKRIVNGLIDGINAVIAKPFDAINIALNKIRNLSIAGLTPFKGKISLITVPRIPHLAQGTVVPPNNKFLAMLGDNTKETEVVSPLSTMKEALMEALAQSRQNITVNVDGRQLFNIIVGQNNAEVRRTGESPLMV